MRGYEEATTDQRDHRHKSHHHDDSDDDYDERGGGGGATFDYSAAQSQMLSLAGLFNTLVDFTKQVDGWIDTCRQPSFLS